MNSSFADDICAEDGKTFPAQNVSAVSPDSIPNDSNTSNVTPVNMVNLRKHQIQRNEVEKPFKKKRVLIEEVDKIPVPVNKANNSPVAILNKYCQNLNYQIVSQSGPSHCTNFTISVEVKGKQYLGSGSSKKVAKAAAATKALAAVVYTAPAPSSVPPLDFTHDDNISPSNKIKAETNGTDVNNDDANNSVTPLSKGLAVTKSPINVVYEIFPDAVFVCKSIDFGTDSCNRRYKVTCEIKGQQFEGHGSSKKSAKLGASKSALAALLAVPNGQTGSSELCSPKLFDMIPASCSTLPQTLADQISKLVIDKFNDLLKSDPIHIRRKVLAGIVMTYGNNYENVEVITVSSGTKCVSGDRLSTSGLAVNDCHAEVISRRCFQDFLYKCLEEIIHSPDGQVGDNNPLILVPGEGFQVRDSYLFHLYISSAPCGDARIFSPHEEACLPPDRHPNRQARGQLRTKIESGEGTIPVKSSGGIQTWDGVLLGERLLTMSCSDKVCRWNVLGVQGALLSVLLPPVYFHSIVLGSLLHPHHLHRAMCGRLVGVLADVPAPFSLNRPLLAQSSSAEQRNAMRAPSFSVNWTIGQPTGEVINAVTGKTELGKPSRLCKQNMFRRWLDIIPRLDPLPSCLGQSILEDSFRTTLGYDIAKSRATLYQNSKLCLFRAFQKANLGNWLKKPIEQDQFHKIDCESSEN